MLNTYLHSLVIIQAFKKGFKWRDMDHDVDPTLDAPPHFQLNSFHGVGPTYTPDTDPQYVPTGLNPDAHPPLIHSLPESVSTTLAPAPWSTGAVPALQPLPRFEHRPLPDERDWQREHARTRSQTRKISRGAPTTVADKPSTSKVVSSTTPKPTVAPTTAPRSAPAPVLARPTRPLVARTTRFTPIGVPGSSQIGANMVRFIFCCHNTLLYN